MSAESFVAILAVLLCALGGLMEAATPQRRRCDYCGESGEHTPSCERDRP